MNEGEDWDVIRAIVADIENLLRQERDPAAERLADLRRVGDRDRAAALTTLASGDMWNHMGSFFDRSLANRELDREFRRAQIRLADALEAAGAATADVRSWASILRTWESQGI